MVTGLIDTNIVVDFLRAYPPSLRWLSTPTNLGINRMAYLEVLEGATNRNTQQRALKRLGSFSLYELTEEDFEWATRRLIDHKLSNNVGMMDCLIASTNHRLQIPLLGALAHEPY